LFDARVASINLLSPSTLWISVMLQQPIEHGMFIAEVVRHRPLCRDHSRSRCP
jgi:hypothetical protein